MATRQARTKPTPGRHEVHFYVSRTEQAAVAARHLGPALTAGHSVLVVADPAETDRIDRALARAGHDVTAARDNGQLVGLTSAEVLRGWFAADGFVESAWRASAGTLLRDLARARGHVQCYGAAVGELWEHGQTEAVAGIESVWARVCGEQSVSMLCGYPARLFATSRQAQGMAQICHAHEAVVRMESDPATPSQVPGDEPSIAEALRRTREARGWSREELAMHSGVSYGAIAQIETGRRNDVRLRSLVALADALGVSLDELAGRPTDP
jgi:DNA-binding XRE family transcriptional regulator